MANSDEQSTPENPFRNDDSTNSNAGDSLGSGKHRDNSDFLSSETNFGSPGSESASPMAGSHRVSRDEFTGGGCRFVRVTARGGAGLRGSGILCADLLGAGRFRPARLLPAGLAAHACAVPEGPRGAPVRAGPGAGFQRRADVWPGSAAWPAERPVGAGAVRSVGSANLRPEPGPGFPAGAAGSAGAAARFRARVAERICSGAATAGIRPGVQPGRASRLTAGASGRRWAAGIPAGIAKPGLSGGASPGLPGCSIG